MKKQIVIIVAFIMAYHVNASVLYVSSGLQFTYSVKRSYSIGFKASLGVYNNTIITNLTSGMLFGKFNEIYGELQCMPFFFRLNGYEYPLVLGGGAGVSMITRKVEKYVLVCPRISAVGGSFFFGNITKYLSGSNQYANMQFSSIINVPIPLMQL